VYSKNSKKEIQYVFLSSIQFLGFSAHAATHPEENNALEQLNQLLQTQMTNFVLADAQSFHVAEHPLFKELIKTAIEIG
jgi:hypothetical protein